MIGLVERCVITPDICLPNPTAVVVASSIVNNPFFVVASLSFFVLALALFSAIRLLGNPDVSLLIRHVFYALVTLILFVPTQWINEAGEERGAGFGMRIKLKVAYDPEKVRQAMSDSGIIAIDGLEREAEVIMPFGMWALFKSASVISVGTALIAEEAISAVNPYGRGGGLFSTAGIEFMSVDFLPSPAELFEEDTLEELGEVFYELMQEGVDGTNVLSAFMDSSPGSKEHELFRELLGRMSFEPVAYLPPITDRIREGVRNSSSSEEFESFCEERIFAAARVREAEKEAAAGKFLRGMLIFTWAALLGATSVMLPLALLGIAESIRTLSFQRAVQSVLALFLSLGFLGLGYGVYKKYVESVDVPELTGSVPEGVVRSEIIWCRILLTEITEGTLEPVKLFDVYLKLVNDPEFSEKLDFEAYSLVKSGVPTAEDDVRSAIIYAYALTAAFSVFEEAVKTYLENRGFSILDPVEGLLKLFEGVKDHAASILLRWTSIIAGALLAAFLQLLAYGVHLAALAYYAIFILLYPVALLLGVIEE